MSNNGKQIEIAEEENPKARNKGKDSARMAQVKKGKLGMGSHQVTQPRKAAASATATTSRVGGSTKLEIYSDKRKVKPTGKPAPANKGSHLSSSSDLKGNSNKSERNRVMNVGRKALVDVSNAQSRFSRSMVRDGSKPPFVAGSKVVKPSSGKSLVPVGNDANARNVLGTSRSKSSSTVNKSIPVDISLSRTKDVALTSSLSENIPAVALHDAARGLTSSCGQDNCNISGLEGICRRSNRRRSYTALLVAGCNLLGQHGIAPVQEKMPSLYNECNELEVAEYVDDIYQYYWVSEAQSPPLANYLSIQTDITPQMRGILINWLVEVHFKFELMQETLYLMVTLLDQYLSQVKIKKKDMQLVGLTSLLLASKYEDYWHPRIKDLISISAESYTRGQVLVMEQLFLKRLKFRLNAPTPYVFMLRFLKAAKSDAQLEHLAFYLIELSLLEYEALKFKPSMLCASAIYLARSTLQLSPAWTPLLVKYARYDASEIRECAEVILKFQKSAGASKLRVTYEKYMRSELSRVAAIKPLDKLLF